MKSPIYLQMAEDGLVMPLATNMVLHGGSSEADIERALGNREEPDVSSCELRAALEYPLAVPHMDLRLEKELLLEGLRLGPGSAPRFHFKQAPTTTEVQAMTTALAAPGTRPSKLRSTPSASSWGRHRDLVPCAMTIGPSR